MAEVEFLFTSVIDEMSHDFDPFANQVALTDKMFDYNKQVVQAAETICLQTRTVVASAVASQSDYADVRVTNFVEATVPNYSDVTFKSHFRMRPSSVEVLCQILSDKLPGRTLDLKRKVLASLWLLSNRETYRSVADRFNLSKGSLNHIFSSFCKVLDSMKSEFICWPPSHKYPVIADAFEKTAVFPGVIGCIDGTHIPIPAPTDFRSSYINRKGLASIQMQAVCDHNAVFTDVCCGMAGSVHDARVYRLSPLKDLLGEITDERYHVLADSAYPLEVHLLTPFRDNGHLTAIQKRYNKCHSSTRARIEHAFGRLKVKFQRLKYLDMTKIENIPSTIVAACVLHNFIIQREGLQNDDQEELECEEKKSDDCLEEAEPSSANVQRNKAASKRNGIAEELFIRLN